MLTRLDAPQSCQLGAASEAPALHLNLTLAWPAPRQTLVRSPRDSRSRARRRRKGPYAWRYVENRPFSDVLGSGSRGLEAGITLRPEGVTVLFAPETLIIAPTHAGDANQYHVARLRCAGSRRWTIRGHPAGIGYWSRRALARLFGLPTASRGPIKLYQRQQGVQVRRGE